jgi:hypothetical protein
VLPKSSDPDSNDTRKCPIGHRGHFLATPKCHRFAPCRKSLSYIVDFDHPNFFTRYAP